MNEMIFFLGGCDLEMQEIRKLLERSRVRFYDRRLAWNMAFLSVYEPEVRLFADGSRYTLYGVELQNDIVPSANYRLIDHHNERSDREASLIQVARLLGKDLTPYMRLVAANDSRYIPGMEALGATRREIEAIRAADRKAQGVTTEEEWLAERAIEENRELIGDLVVVRAFGSRFSPVCDRLYPYDKLLVYTEIEFVYYGKGKDELVYRFHSELTEGKMYHGGGDRGYIGTVRNAFTESELLRMIGIIKRNNHV